MKLKLLVPHLVPAGGGTDCLRPAGFVLDPAPAGYQATPLMEGLDDEGRGSGLCEAEGVGAVSVAVWAVSAGLWRSALTTRRSHARSMTTSRYTITLARRSICECLV